MLPSLHVILVVTSQTYSEPFQHYAMQYLWTSRQDLGKQLTLLMLLKKQDYSKQCTFSLILWHKFWQHSSEAMSAPGVPDPRGSLAASASLRDTLRERFSTCLSNLHIRNACSVVITGSSPDLSADECLWYK